MSAYNTLVQLDSDETNETISNHIHTNSRTVNTERNRVPSPPSPSSTVDVLASNVYNHSQLFPNNSSPAPLLSVAIEDDQRSFQPATPLTTNQTTVDAIDQHLLSPHQQQLYHHHRRSFSDDQQQRNAATGPTTAIPQSLQTHSNQYLNEVHSANSNDGNLINLSQTQQAIIVDDDYDDHDDDDDDYDEDDDQHSIRRNKKHLTSAHDRCFVDDDNYNLHTADDTVEISLLGDTSMDSRESQPLLGCGRDAQDFVYNNFPGESAAHFHT